MKTEVVMKRALFGSEISQRSGSSFFSATDLERAGNMYRLANGLEPFKMAKWLQNKSTKEFILRLEEEFGEVKISARGRGKHTWVHPFLFIDMALAISPDLKIEVYSWLFDELIRYRNESGDSFKKMAGALYQNSKNKRDFPKEIKIVAKKIKMACRVDDWQKSDEKSLKLRDKIQDNIALLTDVLNNNEQAVKIAILKAVDNG